MKILVINCGSSSLKYQLIDSEAEQVLAKGLCERIGIEGSMFTYQKAGCDKVVTQIDQPDHKKSISIVLEALTNKENGVIAEHASENKNCETCMTTCTGQCQYSCSGSCQNSCSGSKR